MSSSIRKSGTRSLDRFFAILTEAVHRFEGTVNQYTGGGIMALFGAPSSPLCSVTTRCARNCCAQAQQGYEEIGAPRHAERISRLPSVSGGRQKDT